MTTHSDKAKETLRLLDCASSTWRFVEYRWVKEEREVLEEQQCPTCKGDRAVIPGTPIPAYPDYLNDKGSVYKEKLEAYTAYNAKIREIVPNCWAAGNCPTCIRKKFRCTGRALVKVKRIVTVGYPIWPQGTRFDSRFQGGCTCGLCGKTVLKSRLVPLLAEDSKGVTHAIFAGIDCTQKILGLNFKLKKDQQIELGEIK